MKIQTIYEKGHIPSQKITQNVAFNNKKYIKKGNKKDNKGFWKGKCQINQNLNKK